MLHWTCCLLVGIHEEANSSVLCDGTGGTDVWNKSESVQPKPFLNIQIKTGYRRERRLREQILHKVRACLQEYMD